MRRAFGSLIAILLLVLYVYLVSRGIAVVNCAHTVGCTAPAAGDFTSAMSSYLLEIGGLVSALVISELAVTQPGQVPVARTLGATASINQTRAVAAISIVYLLVWLGAGLWAFLIGLTHPDTVPAITDLGKAWFGLAIAAAYAYFGIQR